MLCDASMSGSWRDLHGAIYGVWHATAHGEDHRVPRPGGRARPQGDVSLHRTAAGPADPRGAGRLPGLEAARRAPRLGRVLEERARHRRRRRPAGDGRRVITLDTSAVVALVNRSDVRHAEAARALA